MGFGIYWFLKLLVCCVSFTCYCGCLLNWFDLVDLVAVDSVAILVICSWCDVLLGVLFNCGWGLSAGLGVVWFIWYIWLIVCLWFWCLVGVDIVFEWFWGWFSLVSWVLFFDCCLFWLSCCLMCLLFVFLLFCLFVWCRLLIVLISRGVVFKLWFVVWLFLLGWCGLTCLIG